MALTLTEYWNALEASLIAFDKTNTITAQDTKDDQVYQKQRNFLNSMLKLGLKLEMTTWAIFKKPIGNELQTLPEMTFGKERVITSFGGPLSVTFAQQVYLPHLQTFDEVTVANQSTLLQTFCNLPKQKQDVSVLVNKLEVAIKNYHREKASVLTVLSVFAAPNGYDESFEQILRSPINLTL